MLDVGCGGGLLSEVHSPFLMTFIEFLKTFQSLARLGANTTGIDAAQSNVAIASLHASSDPSLSFTPPSDFGLSIAPSPQPLKARGSLTYQHTSVEELLAHHGPGKFDVVCSMEVLEHVDNPRDFITDCAQLVKVNTYTTFQVCGR